MSNTTENPLSAKHDSKVELPSNYPVTEDSVDDFQEILQRISRGRYLILATTFLGLGLSTLFFIVFSPLVNARTSTRVTFAFDGYSKGEYPDHSKFDPDDIRAPEIIAEAMRRQNIDSTGTLQSTVRSGLTIEGIVPAIVIKERDRLRAAGQNPPTFIPEEYLLTLNLPQSARISDRQRELLLNEIVSVYHEKFKKTYISFPEAIGSAFNTLRSADYVEYEQILSAEVHNLSDFIDRLNAASSTFRSQTTNLSFGDIKEQLDIFTRVRVNEVLGIITAKGLSRNRETALLKLAYYLKRLREEATEAAEQEQVVDNLLAKTQSRSENYVLGIKSQAVEKNQAAPLLDQGLIDSLLANDAYNFLVRRALDAGLKVKAINAEEERVNQRISDLQSASALPDKDLKSAEDSANKAIMDLQESYTALIARIRDTFLDYSRQQFADAIRISMQPKSENRLLSLILASLIGSIAGAATGFSLAALGLPSRTRPSI
jgi:hypothetical protein